MGAMASQITSLTIVYSTVYSDADQRKHQSSASLAFAVTGEFAAQMASNAENVSIWSCHHEFMNLDMISSLWLPHTTKVLSPTDAPSILMAAIKLQMTN